MNGKLTIAVLLALAVFTASAQFNSPLADTAAAKLREAGLDTSPFRDVIEQFSHMDKSSFLINGDHRLCYKLEYRGRLVLCCDEPQFEEFVAEEEEESAAVESNDEPVEVFFAPESFFNHGGRRNLQNSALSNLQFNLPSLSSVCPPTQSFTNFGNCLTNELSDFANKTSNSTLNSTDFQNDSDAYLQCVNQVTAQLQQSSSASQTCLDALNGVYQVFSQCGMTSNSTDIVGLTQNEITCLSSFTSSLNSLVSGNGSGKMGFVMAALMVILGVVLL